MIKTMIVEDSPLYQRFLKNILEEDEYLDVIGCASTAKEALEMLKCTKPDMITLDLHLPDVKEYELLETILSKYSIPVIVVTSNGQACEQAMEKGASDFIEKIEYSGKNSMDQFGLLLRMKIKSYAHIWQPRRSEISSTRLQTNEKEIIVIGASLGGTEAVLEVLKDLPEDTPGVVVVQHMPPGFTNAFAMRLDRNCKMQVVEAKDGMQVERGKVVIAKGGEQLTIHRGVGGYYVKSGHQERVSGFCPSVDVLFSSAAELTGCDIVGIILTGIGNDGAKGMKKLHQAGAYTIGQNEETCVVYGMPAKAKEMGAIDRELPIQIISRMVIRHFEE